jgi:hypothetical protein
MGLAQCIKLPGDSGLTNLCGGGTPYDPFNPTHSICCGTHELKSAITSADNFLRANWEALSACANGMTDDEYGWAKYYLAANMYYGGPAITFKDIDGIRKPVLPTFVSQRDLHGQCAGEQHYIRYLRNNFSAATLGTMRNSEYGAKQLTIYLDAIPKCQSDCPGAFPTGGLTPGETGDMRAFGHSLAEGTFKSSEATVTQQLSAAGVSATVEPTISRVGQPITETTRNVWLAGQHHSIVLYAGANDLSRNEADIRAAFDELFAAAASKADRKVYVFNIIEFGSSVQWAKIASINTYLRNYVNAHSPKFVLVDINQQMSTLGSGCPYHSGDTHGCYPQTRSYFVSQVAASQP